MIRREVKLFLSQFGNLDKKVVTVFITVAFLQTLSWYFTSRRFFREYLFDYFLQAQDPYLIEYLYWFVGDFFTFVLPTLLIIKLFFKESISDYGFNTGNWKLGISLSMVFLLIMMPVIWFISASDVFIQKYPHLSSARESWEIFFIYELGMLVYMIGWEFFWRGFMLFGLEEKFGLYSIFIQMIPFVILHNGKPFIETLGAIPGGIALGWLALSTRSFYYCVVVHIGVMYSIDLISVIRYRTNEYGIGFQSLFNIIGNIF